MIFFMICLELSREVHTFVKDIESAPWVRASILQSITPNQEWCSFVEGSDGYSNTSISQWIILPTLNATQIRRSSILRLEFARQTGQGRSRTGISQGPARRKTIRQSAFQTKIASRLSLWNSHQMVLFRTMSAAIRAKDRLPLGRSFV